MKYLNTVAALIAALAFLSASPADAQMQQSKPGKGMQDRSQEVADRVEMERDKHTRRDKKSREQINDAMEDEHGNIDDEEHRVGDDDVVRDKSVKAKNKSAKMKDKSDKGLDNAAERGNEKSQEMRARRDERKMIKEEYKAGSKGSEGELDANEVLDADAGEASADGEKKEKKPWWKFWNQ